MAKTTSKNPKGNPKGKTAQNKTAKKSPTPKTTAGRKRKVWTLADYRKAHRKIPGTVVKEYEGEFVLKADSRGVVRPYNPKVGADGKQAVKRRNNSPLGRPPTDPTIHGVYYTAKTTKVNKK